GAWLNHLGAKEAVSTLYRGQADLLETALRTRFPPFRSAVGTVDSVSLAAFVDSFPEHGLTYLAVVDSRGTVHASVGSPAAPLELPSVRGVAAAEQRSVDLGGRIRLVLMLGVAGPEWGGDRGGRSGQT